jgi:hypothetical protein
VLNSTHARHLHASAKFHGVRRRKATKFEVPTIPVYLVSGLEPSWCLLW